MDLVSTKNEMEPRVLAEIIHSKADNILLVDCRNFLDYNFSHIRSSINAFYSKIVRRRILNSKNCTESVLTHLPRTINDTFSRSFHQFTLILYGNGTEGGLSTFHFSSQSSTSSTLSKFSLRRSASEETSTNLLDSNNFINILLERLQNTNTFSNVLLLKGGFNEFRKCFPDLCESSSLNTPQTGIPSPFQLNEPSCGRLDAKCAKLQSPMSTMKKLSNSTSHPSLSTYRTVCSSEGSSPNTQITQILDFFFLGSQEDAQSPTILKRHGITKVINLSDTCPKSDLIPNEANYFLRIPIKDSYDAKLYPFFDKAFDFIEEAKRTNQRVLVHCLAGISRSPTLAIAYIMRSRSLTCDEAYKFVKKLRPSVSPNLNFMGQLFLYERHLRDQKILPPAVRPRSNVIEDYTPPCSKEVQMSAAEPLPPSIENENLCKSASVDFSLLSSELPENRKRIMDSPLSLPCRPRQLMKNCCARKNLDNSPQLPSPSSEFSKLDISLSNPCFANSMPSTDPQTPQPSTPSQQTNVENPVFGLSNDDGDKSHLATRIKSNKKNSASSQMFNLLLRRPTNCKMTSTSRLRCKMGKCFSKQCQKPSLILEQDTRSTNVDQIKLKQARFSRFTARTPLNVMPTLHDMDDVDSGKGSSISQSLSTEEGDGQTSALSISKPEDPERESISSTSSLEIAVQ